MGICPNCKEEIDWMMHYESGEKQYKVTSDGVDNLDYEDDGFEPNGQVNDFECPECSEVLFTDEREAGKFLSKIQGKIE